MTASRAWFTRLAAATLAGLLVAPVLAQEGKREKGDVRPAVRGDASRARGWAGEEELNEMVAKLHPTPEQQAALAERLRAKASVLTSFDEQNRVQIKELQQKIKESQDRPAESAQFQEQLRNLQAQRDAVAEGQDAQVQAVMPVDMRVNWLTPKLSQAAIQRYRSNKITPDQENQIRMLCEIWIRQTLMANQPVAARPKVTPPLAKQIEMQVLTEEQRPRGSGSSSGSGSKSSGATTKPTSKPTKS